MCKMRFARGVWLREVDPRCSHTLLKDTILSPFLVLLLELQVHKQSREPREGEDAVARDALGRGLLIEMAN